MRALGGVDASVGCRRANKRSTVVGWINRKARKLDWLRVEAQLRASPAGVELCRASLESWRRYVESESQAVAASVMKWRDGVIYIVDVPNRLHDAMVEALVFAVSAATRSGARYLETRTGSQVDDDCGTAPRLDPDVGFAPSESVAFGWSEYQTLKVEVDATSRGWAGLDNKAGQCRQYAGVEYVLSILLSPQSGRFEFRLDAVNLGEFELPRSAVRSIAGPATLVTMDSRRLLGLMDHEVLPEDFPDPEIAIDLFAAVHQAVREANAEGA